MLVVVALVGCGDAGEPDGWRSDPELVECMQADYEYAQSFGVGAETLDQHVADLCGAEMCADETDCVLSFCGGNQPDGAIVAGVPCRRQSVEASSNTLNP